MKTAPASIAAPSFRRFAAGTLAATIATLALCSCVSVGSRESTFTAPGHWQNDVATSAAASGETLDTAALAQWWEQFDDPVLSALIEDALKSNPDIHRALSVIAEARARWGLENANRLPTIAGGVSGSGVRNSDRTTSTTVKTESYTAALDATWEIDLFGQRRATVAAASADLAQTAEQLHAAQVSLAAEVASSYVTLRAAEARRAVVERSVATRSETLELTRWREETGNTSALETQQSTSALEQARASLPALQQTIAQTRNQLALLAGKTPGALDELLATTGRIPSTPASLSVGIPAETLRQRPDVRAAGHAVEAAIARTTAAQRERLPSLALSGSLGVDALTAGDLFSPANTVANLVGSLSAPIFQAGRIRQTIAIQGELEKQALITYESTVLTALSDVESALIAIQRSSDRRTILDRAVTAAREAETLATQQYEAGIVDLLTVLDAQRTLLGLAEQQVETTAALTTAHIQLYKALGGGWSSANS